MKKKFSILYVHPCHHDNQNYLLSGILRISNYLNSKKVLLKQEIQEEYIDLRLEDLPKFSYEAIEDYRKGLKDLLINMRNNVDFDVVAISCFSSIYYLNTLEIAYLIKQDIKQDCIIVVGGVHPTIRQEEFAIEGIPLFLQEAYPKVICPINVVMREEAEIGFFKLIQSLMEKQINGENIFTDKFNVITSEIAQDLDQLPVIDLSLYEKYKEHINQTRSIHIDFCRGCPHRCLFCTNSTDYMKCYRNVRLKSVDKCFEELDAIYNTEWLSITTIFIIDPIFFPNRKLRNKFFEKLILFRENHFGFPWKVVVLDRIDMCTKEDLEKYHNYNIDVQFGLETVSEKLLHLINKTSQKNIPSYIEKTKELIKYSNQAGINIQFSFMQNLPGTTENIFNEIHDFFFKEKNGNHPLMKEYFINISWRLYEAFPGTRIYEECEERFGSFIYYKNWWKLPRDDQRDLSRFNKPSANFSLQNSLQSYKTFIQKAFELQHNKTQFFFRSQLYLSQLEHIKKLKKLSIL
ncbi:MAG: B12-binding domain-containing radical SAM protein [Promethearchaeota archaeon]